MISSFVRKHSFGGVFVKAPTAPSLWELTFAKFQKKCDFCHYPVRSLDLMPPSEQLAIKNVLSLLSKSWNWRRTISTSMIHKSKHHFWTMHWQVPLCPLGCQTLEPRSLLWLCLRPLMSQLPMRYKRHKSGKNRITNHPPLHWDYGRCVSQRESSEWDQGEARLLSEQHAYPR